MCTLLVTVRTYLVGRSEALLDGTGFGSFQEASPTRHPKALPNSSHSMNLPCLSRVPMVLEPAALLFALIERTSLPARNESGLTRVESNSSHHRIVILSEVEGLTTLCQEGSFDFPSINSGSLRIYLSDTFPNILLGSTSHE